MGACLSSLYSWPFHFLPPSTTSIDFIHWPETKVYLLCLEILMPQAYKLLIFLRIHPFKFRKSFALLITSFIKHWIAFNYELDCFVSTFLFLRLFDALRLGCGTGLDYKWFMSFQSWWNFKACVRAGKKRKNFILPRKILRWVIKNETWEIKTFRLHRSERVWVIKMSAENSVNVDALRHICQSVFFCIRSIVFFFLFKTCLNIVMSSLNDKVCKLRWRKKKLLNQVLKIQQRLGTFAYPTRMFDFDDVEGHKARFPMFHNNN